MSNLMATDSGRAPANNVASVGVLTKTKVYSPVVHWILEARVRSATTKDVAFIGEDFLLVKQVMKDGHMIDIAIKNDFDAPIRAAAVLHIEKDIFDDEAFVKADMEAPRLDNASSDLIVLTLDSNVVVFVCLRPGRDGWLDFVQSSLAIPTFGRQSIQPGTHVARDPFSRAIAIAANEKQIVIYSMKRQEQIWQDMHSNNTDWCPVMSRKLLRIEGTIQQMDFLYPELSDKDHVILLLIVVIDNRTKAVWVDWHVSLGLSDAHQHPEQALDWAQSIPVMLIPLQNATFLLFTGDKITLWRNLTSGSAEGDSFLLLEHGDLYPGNSRCRPSWTRWSRTCRVENAGKWTDKLYVLREDGVMFMIRVQDALIIETDYIGNLQMHHGTAFASVMDAHGRDLVIAAGEMSPGVLAFAWDPTLFAHHETTDSDSPHLEIVERLPNWASVTEMAGSDFRRLNRAASRNVENILVTSGRQPFGSITELREGLEARMLGFAEIPGLDSVSEIWALPTIQGDTVLFMSDSSATKLLLLDSMLELEEPEAMTAFDTDRRTLCAGNTADGRLTQVTPNKIVISNSDCTSTEILHAKPDEMILAAALVAQPPIIITAEQHGNQYIVQCRSLQDLALESFTVPSQPICVAGSSTPGGLLICAATTDGKITTSLVSPKNGSSKFHCMSIPVSGGEDTACDCISILARSKDSSVHSEHLVVCGLRDGKIISFSYNESFALTGQHPLDHRETIQFGFSTVRLVPLQSDPASALALSGSDACWVSWTCHGKQSLTVESIWVTDRCRPDYAQNAIVSVAQLPVSSFNTTNTVTRNMIMASGNDLMIVSLDFSARTVPRHISVHGTPYRLIYANSLRSFVTVSICTDARAASSNSPALPQPQTRRIWPAIHFISKRSRPSITYNMQPGDRVFSVVEWSYRRDDKRYSHILLGGSYISKTSGARRGQVSFLKPLVSDWIVTGVDRVRSEKFKDEVYALAMYDSITYIACAGEKVYLNRVSIESGSWSQVCSPFQLASRGIHITVEERTHDEPLIFIATARDSVVILSLQADVAKDGQTQTRSLVPFAFPPQAESLLSHFVVPVDVAPGLRDDESRLVLLSTKYCKLLGMECGINSPPRSGRTLFEAFLPRSLTRFMRFSPPERKLQLPEGMMSHGMVGCSADGSLTSISLLDESLWRRLFWLQRLCEWSETLSPHSYLRPAYDTNVIDPGQSSRALPVGLGSPENAIMLRTTLIKANDMHVDGDVLSRVLARGGSQAVEAVMRRLASREDSVGAWMRENLEKEIACVNPILDLVRQVLKSM